MQLIRLEYLDRETKEGIQNNNDKYARREISHDEHEENYELLMQTWRLETERILSTKYNP